MLCRLCSASGPDMSCALVLCCLQAVPALQLQQDRDADMGSEFFETRQAFLSLCQGNHYQVGGSGHG